MDKLAYLLVVLLATGYLPVAFSQQITGRAEAAMTTTTTTTTTTASISYCPDGASAQTFGQHTFCCPSSDIIAAGGGTDGILGCISCTPSSVYYADASTRTNRSATRPDRCGQTVPLTASDYTQILYGSMSLPPSTVSAARTGSSSGGAPVLTADPLLVAGLGAGALAGMALI